MGYHWTNKGNASGVSFTFGNNVYTYDAINNVIKQIGSAKTTRKNDLVFVLRNLENAEIVNNAFKIYINHYPLK